MIQFTQLMLRDFGEAHVYTTTGYTRLEDTYRQQVENSTFFIMFCLLCSSLHLPMQNLKCLSCSNCA